MADENNNEALLQEINSLLDQLKQFPENRDDATDEQKQQITEIYKQLFEKESYKHTSELDEEHQALHRSSTYFNEKQNGFISVQPFLCLQDFATKIEQSENKEVEKEKISRCFEAIFNQVAADYKLSSDELSILATYLPVFGAEAQSVLKTMQNQAEIIAKLNAQAPKEAAPAPQPMSEEDKEKVDKALTTLRTTLQSKKLNKNKTTRPTIRKAFETFSTNLDGVQGAFTPKQIADLQAILQPFRENPKLSDINVDKSLEDASKKDGNKYTPSEAFTQLYAQLAPDYQARQEQQALANDFRQRLTNVVTQLNELQEENVNEDPAPDAPQEENDGEDQGFVIDIDEYEDASSIPPAMTEEEVNKYLDEVRQSDNEDSYLSKINPAISDASIISSMALEASTISENGVEQQLTEVQSRALALANPDDLLVAYHYYEENDAEKLPEVKAVIAESLRNSAHDNLTPENAFVWLTLADKIKNDEEYQGAYTAFTEGLAGSLRDYDEKTFKGKSAEELAENYTAAKEGLEQLSPEFLNSLIEGYTFTDDNGKPLEDKNRGLIMSVLRGGKGNERSDTLDGMFETARLMAAQELAAEGLPNDPDLRKQVLESKMREQMETILHLNTDPALIDGANLLVEYAKNLADKKLQTAKETNEKSLQEIEAKFNEDKAKIEAEYKQKIAEVEASKKGKEKAAEKEKLEKEKAAELKALKEKRQQDINAANQIYQAAKTDHYQTMQVEKELRQESIQELLIGDENKLKAIATLQARKELGLPLDKEPDFGKDEAKRREYLNKQDEYLTKLQNGQKNSTSFTKSQLGARLGGVMVATHDFQARAHQHFPKTALDTQSNSWWNNLDQKLTDTFGKPYIYGKQAAKLIGNTAWGMAKTTAVTAALTWGGNLIAPGVGTAAVCGYFAYKQFKNVKQQWKTAESKAEKAAIVASGVIMTGMSTAATLFGMGGSSEAMTQLGNNLTQFLVQKGARAGLTALAVCAPNLVKGFMLKRKNKKLQEKIDKEQDPKKKQQLIQDQKQVQGQIKQNKQKLLTKGGAVLVGSLIGAGLSAHAQGSEGSDTPLTDENSAQMSTDQAQMTPGDGGNGGGPNGPDGPNNGGNGGNGGDGGNTGNDAGASAQPDAGTSFAANEDGVLEPQSTQDFLAGLVGADNNQDNASADDPNLVGPRQEDGDFYSDEAQALQHAESNLNEAREPGTGWRGQSSYDSAHNNLNDYKGALGMNDEQVDATAQKMCEVYGDDAYKATHAALAEPAHLASAMGLTSEDLGLQPGQTLTSARLLDYMQTHDMSGNEGFNNYMSTHFHTDQQLFTPSDQPAHINTGTHHENVPHDNNTPRPVVRLENTTPNEIRYEVVDRLPGQPQQQPVVQVVQEPAQQGYPASHSEYHQYHRPLILNEEYTRALHGKPNGTLGTTEFYAQDPTTGQWYEALRTPGGTIRYHERTEDNIIEEYRQSPYGSARQNYYHGTGVISYAPNQVDRTIGYIHAGIGTVQDVAVNLEQMGVIKSDIVDKVLASGNIGHSAADFVGIIRHNTNGSRWS